MPKLWGISALKLCAICTLDLGHTLCYDGIVKEWVQKRAAPLNRKGGAAMPIKFDRLFALFDEKGITTYKIRKEKIVGNETLRKLKANAGVIDTRTIDKLCDVLDCQPGDFMEHIPGEEKEGSA
jgi:putative transcriptional regulator